MSQRITADTGDIRALAQNLVSLARQVEALKTNASGAVAPAERGDVPELGLIETGDVLLRGSIAKLGADLFAQAAALRGYANTLEYVETLITLYRMGITAQDCKPLLGGPLRFEATAGSAGSFTGGDGTYISGKEAFEFGVAGINAEPWGLPTVGEGLDRTLDLEAGVGAWRAGSIALKSGAAPLQLFLDVRNFRDPHASRYQQVYAATDATVTTVGMGSTALTVLGAEGGSLATMGAAGAAVAAPAGVALAGIGFGGAVGNHLRHGYEADEAAHRSSMVRIGDNLVSQSRSVGFLPAAGNAALQTAGLGIYKGSESIAKKIWPDPPARHELDGHTAAVLTAAIQQTHPGSSLAIVDGSFYIRIKDGDNYDIVHLNNHLELVP